MTEDQKLDLILAAVHGIRADVQELKTDVQHLETRMTSLEGKVEGLEGKVDNLENGIESLDQKATRIKVILENEICVSIQRVAEGHLDLVRNLQDAMKHSNEVEMLAVRVNLLTSDVKELKQKVS